MQTVRQILAFLALAGVIIGGLGTLLTGDGKMMAGGIVVGACIMVFLALTMDMDETF